MAILAMAHPMHHLLITGPSAKEVILLAQEALAPQPLVVAAAAGMAVALLLGIQVVAAQDMSTHHPQLPTTRADVCLHHRTI